LKTLVNGNTLTRFTGRLTSGWQYPTKGSQEFSIYYHPETVLTQLMAGTPL
jgi:hypothetical protein